MPIAMNLNLRRFSATGWGAAQQLEGATAACRGYVEMTMLGGKPALVYEHSGTNNNMHFAKLS